LKANKQLSDLRNRHTSAVAFYTQQQDQVTKELDEKVAQLVKAQEEH